MKIQMALDSRSLTRRESIFIPERSRLEVCIAVLVFLASFAYLCLFRRYTAMEPDEGIILQGAERILRGDVLYRDFFSYFTPGSYYLLALLFKIFGSSMLVARTALAIYGALFSVFTYVMARRVCSRWAAIAAAYLVTFTCLPWRFNALHNWDSTLWACAALYCATRFIEAPHSGWALGMGSFASLAVLFEQSKGAGLTSGLVLGFATLALLDRRRVRRYGAHWIALGMGFAWPFLLTFAYFGTHHAMGALLTDWLWPLHHYSSANSIPYGYQDWSDQSREMLFRSGPWLGRGLALFAVSPCFLLPVLPIIAMVLLAYWVLEARRRRLAPGHAAYYILFCSTLAGLLLSVIVVRSNIIHFVYLAPLYYLVLAWMMDGTDIRGSLISSIRPLVTAGVLLTFTAVGMAFLVTNRGARLTVETRRGTVRIPTQDSVLEYTQAHVPAGSKILVYPYLPLYNYLTATFSPTRYEYLQPGMHTREQEEEAIREVEEDRTPVVLFEPGYIQRLPASRSSIPLNVMAARDVGAEYILAHYRNCKTLNSGLQRSIFVFMVRKDLSCAGPL